MSDVYAVILAGGKDHSCDLFGKDKIHEHNQTF